MFRQSAPLPPPAALALQQAPGAPSVGGLDSGARVAWLAVGGDLHVWRCDGAPGAPSGHACVRLPRTATAAASQPPLVAAVLTGPRGGEDIFLVVALPDTGALLTWPRASSAASAPAQGLQYLPSTPTSLVARPGRGGAVLALVGCVDGSLCRVDVSPDGAATVATCTRPWEEGGAAEAQTGPGGAQQLLGRATRGALSLLRASGRPLPRASVQCLAWSDAPELQSPGHACALVLTENALEAVSLPLVLSAGEDGPGSFTFSRGALATAQAALRDTGARVLAFGAASQGVVLLAATAGSRRSAPHALWLLHCATEAQPPHGGLTLLRAPVALTDASDAVRVTVPGGVSCCVGARHVMVANTAANTAAVVSDVDGSLVVPFTGECVLAGAWATQDGDGRLLTSAGMLHWQPTPAVPPSPLTRAPRGRDGAAPQSGGGDATGPVLEAFHSGAANLEALHAAGCFDASAGDSNPLVDAMRRVLNTLPKRWGDASADNEVAHAATVLQQLGDKAASLVAFLEWAAGTGVWQRCTPPTKAAMLTCVEQLSGVLRLRRFCNDLLPGSPGSGALRDALAAAGTAIPGGPDTGPRHPVDGVFEQPSHAEGFFTAAAQALDAMTQRAAVHADGEAQDAHSLWAAASALCGAILEVLLGAREARSAQAARYPPASEAPLRWTASAAVIAALKAAAAAAAGCAASSELAQRALLDIATYLLDAAAAARDSEAPGTAARMQLHGQYAQLRDWLLPALLAAAVGGGEQGAPGRGEAPALSLDAVAQLAAQHGAHTTMYAVCAVTGEWERLLDWMRQLPGGGPDGEPSFSGAVFACMLDDGRVTHLLDGLPDEWNSQLSEFLGQTPHLGWMHALRCGDYPAAAQLLMRVGTAGRQPGAVGALDALRLAKLAHMAAGAADDDPPVVAADAACELHALQLQTAVAGDAAQLMLPGALAEALLNAAHIEPAQRPLAAMRVFLASSASTRAQHATLIHRVWVEAARQTDWAAVAESKGQLSDDAYLDALAQTPLAQAADACFAPDRLVMEPPFARGGEVGGELEVGDALQQELGAGSEALRDALRVGAAGWEIRMVDGLGDADMA
jgi:hypothetical protein